MIVIIVQLVNWYFVLDNLIIIIINVDINTPTNKYKTPTINVLLFVLSYLRLEHKAADILSDVSDALILFTNKSFGQEISSMFVSHISAS